MAEPRPYDERVVGARPVDAESNEESRRMSAGRSEANEARPPICRGTDCSGRATDVRASASRSAHNCPRTSALRLPRSSEHRPLRASPRIASDHDDVRSASDGGVDVRRATRDDLVASHITISAREGLGVPGCLICRRTGLSSGRTWLIQPPPAWPDIERIRLVAGRVRRTGRGPTGIVVVRTPAALVTAGARPASARGTPRSVSASARRPMRGHCAL